jgi:hypothetical protein
MNHLDKRIVEILKAMNLSNPGTMMNAQIEGIKDILFGKGFEVLFEGAGVLSYDMMQKMLS